MFPFFKAESHHFLSEKWWFRLLTVLYLIGVVVFLFEIWDSLFYSAWGWCYDLASSYMGDAGGFRKHLDGCGEILESTNRASVLAEGLAVTIFLHYLIQFIFYKVIINFIVLGGKDQGSKMSSR